MLMMILMRFCSGLIRCFIVLSVVDEIVVMLFGRLLVFDIWVGE